MCVLKKTGWLRIALRKIPLVPSLSYAGMSFMKQRLHFLTFMNPGLFLLASRETISRGFLVAPKPSVLCTATVISVIVKGGNKFSFTCCEIPTNLVALKQANATERIG